MDVLDEDGTPLASPLVGFADASDYLGVSQETLRHWLWRGVGPRSYKIGRRRKFRLSDLDAYIEAHAEEPAS